MDHENEESKMTAVVAEADIKRWLDHRGVSRHKREANKGTLEDLCGLVEEGFLIVNEDCTLTLKLHVPVGNHGQITEFKFKARCATSVIDTNNKNVPAGDFFRRLKGAVTALTDQPFGIVNSLESEDMSRCNNIALFFT